MLKIDNKNSLVNERNHYNGRDDVEEKKSSEDGSSIHKRKKDVKPRAVKPKTRLAKQSSSKKTNEKEISDAKRQIMRQAKQEAITELNKLLDTPKERDLIATALDGKTREERSPEEQAEIDNFLSNPKIRRQIMQRLRKVKIFTAKTGNVNDKNGENVLPDGVRGAYLDDGKIILLRSLNPKQMGRTVLEELGEAFSDLAKEKGIRVADGDVGNRILRVLDGKSISPKDKSKLFTKDELDTSKVRFNGKTIEARARDTSGESLIQADEVDRVTVSFETSDTILVLYTPNDGGPSRVIAVKAGQTETRPGEVQIKTVDVSDQLPEEIDGNFSIVIVDKNDPNGGYVVATTADKVKNNFKVTLIDSEDPSKGYKVEAIPVVGEGFPSKTTAIVTKAKNGEIRINFDSFGDGEISGKDPDGNFNAVGDRDYNDVIITISPPNPKNETSPPKPPVPAKPPVIASEEDDDGDDKTPPPPPKVPTRKDPKLSVASPDSTNEVDGYEDSSKPTQIYVEISFRTADALIVEIYDPKQKKWIKIGEKDEGYKEFSLDIQKLTQYGDNRPKVRVRNMSLGGAIISGNDSLRARVTELDGKTIVEFEDRATVDEDGTVTGDDYKDVVITFYDKSPQGIITDDPIDTRNAGKYGIVSLTLEADRAYGFDRLEVQASDGSWVIMSEIDGFREWTHWKNQVVEFTYDIEQGVPKMRFVTSKGHIVILEKDDVDSRVDDYEEYDNGFSANVNLPNEFHFPLIWDGNETEIHVRTREVPFEQGYYFTMAYGDPNKNDNDAWAVEYLNDDDEWVRSATLDKYQPGGFIPMFINEDGIRTPPVFRFVNTKTGDTHRPSGFDANGASISVFNSGDTDPDANRFHGLSGQRSFVIKDDEIWTGSGSSKSPGEFGYFTHGGDDEVINEEGLALRSPDSAETYGYVKFSMAGFDFRPRPDSLGFSFLDGLEFNTKGLNMPEDIAKIVISGINGGQVSESDFENLKETGVVVVNESAGTWTIDKTKISDDDAKRILDFFFTEESGIASEEGLDRALFYIGLSKQNQRKVDQLGNGNGKLDRGDIRLITGIDNLFMPSISKKLISLNEEASGSFAGVDVLDSLPLPSELKKEIWDLLIGGNGPGGLGKLTEYANDFVNSIGSELNDLIGGALGNVNEEIANDPRIKEEIERLKRQADDGDNSKKVEFSFGDRFSVRVGVGVDGIFYTDVRFNPVLVNAVRTLIGKLGGSSRGSVTSEDAIVFRIFYSPVQASGTLTSAGLTNSSGVDWKQVSVAIRVGGQDLSAYLFNNPRWGPLNQVKAGELSFSLDLSGNGPILSSVSLGFLASSFKAWNKKSVSWVLDKLKQHSVTIPGYLPGLFANASAKLVWLAPPGGFDSSNRAWTPDIIRFSTAADIEFSVIEQETQKKRKRQFPPGDGGDSPPDNPPMPDFPDGVRPPGLPDDFIPSYRYTAQQLTNLGYGRLDLTGLPNAENRAERWYNPELHRVFIPELGLFQNVGAPDVFIDGVQQLAFNARTGVIVDIQTGRQYLRQGTITQQYPDGVPQTQILRTGVIFDEDGIPEAETVDESDIPPIGIADNDDYDLDIEETINFATLSERELNRIVVPSDNPQLARLVAAARGNIARIYSLRDGGEGVPEADFTRAGQELQRNMRLIFGMNPATTDEQPAVGAGDNFRTPRNFAYLTGIYTAAADRHTTLPSRWNTGNLNLPNPEQTPDPVGEDDEEEQIIFIPPGSPDEEGNSPSILPDPDLEVPGRPGAGFPPILGGSNGFSVSTPRSDTPPTDGLASGISVDVPRADLTDLPIPDVTGSNPFDPSSTSDVENPVDAGPVEVPLPRTTGSRSWTGFALDAALFGSISIALTTDGIESIGTGTEPEQRPDTP